MNSLFNRPQAVKPADFAWWTAHLLGVPESITGFGLPPAISIKIAIHPRKIVLFIIYTWLYAKTTSPIQNKRSACNAGSFILV